MAVRLSAIRMGSGGRRLRSRQHFALVLAIIVALAAAGCAPQLLRNPVPAKAYAAPLPTGLGDVRYWGDQLPPHLSRLIEEKFQQVVTNRPWLVTNPKNPLAFLALSGGGSDGAYGAGVLVGWTAAGTRPEFEIVTGISTGALIAPFAFLGSHYDHVLTELYTTYSTKDVVETDFLAGVLGGAAVTEVTKLEQLIERYISTEVLHKIAIEHARGRRLLIGTTNLDAQRPVIWDMGAIASRGTPESATLFRKVLLASASIPAVFPPVLINIDEDDGVHDEMHVDGGTTSQVFFLPPAVLSAGLKNKSKSASLRKLYVILNNKLDPEYEAVKPTTFAIARRSISTLIKSAGRGDLFRLRETALASGVGMRIAAVPDSFEGRSTEPFDLDYMRLLYQLGYQQAATGYSWHDGPLGP